MKLETEKIIRREYGVIIHTGHRRGRRPFDRDNIRFGDEDDIVPYLQENCEKGDRVWINRGKVYTNENGEISWTTAEPIGWERPFENVIRMFGGSNK